MKRFVVLIGIVVVLAVAWMAGWLFIADRVRAEIALLAHADGVGAPRLECGQLDVTGFPFSFAPRCRDAVLSLGDGTLEVAQIHATALFYRPQHIQIFGTGPARITDAFTGSTQEVRWRNLHASLRLSGERLTRFSLVMDDILYADVLFGDVVLAQASRGEVHLVDATGGGAASSGAVYDFYTRLDDLDSPGLDVAQGHVTLGARLTGVPDMALWGHPELLRLWQMAGGDLVLRGFEGTAEGLSFAVRGEARLDEAGLVNGAFAVSSQGVVERFPELADDPRVPMLLGQPDTTGTYSQSVAIRNGRISVGIIPIQALPPLF